MKYHIIRFVFFCLFIVLGITGYAQDLMARQAPLDRKLKAVDSVSLQRAIRQEMSEMISDIYPVWSNEHVNAYKDFAKPNTFPIDLRGFSMPTPSRVITSRYGYRRSFRRYHYGLDVKVYTGDTIYAAFSGKARIVSYDRRGYGYYIVLRHANGLETVYGHLSRQFIHENDIVRSGEPIGLGGSTGRSTGAHLHFETRLLGEPINPELLFDFPNQDVTCDVYTYRYGNNDKKVDLPADWDDEISGENKAAATEMVMVDEPETEEPVVLSHKKSAKSRSLYHKVKKGDSLYSIAKKNKITLQQLCALNGISKKTKLLPGQILKTR